MVQKKTKNKWNLPEMERDEIILVYAKAICACQVKEDGLLKRFTELLIPLLQDAGFKR